MALGVQAATERDAQGVSCWLDAPPISVAHGPWTATRLISGQRAPSAVSFSESISACASEEQHVVILVRNQGLSQLDKE